MRNIRDYYAPVLGEFEALVLMSLLRLGNGAYGAAIRREIHERTGREVSDGTLYMTLHRLERKQMIVSYTGAPTASRGGRRRRHYVINDPGERALGRAWRALKALSEGLDETLSAL